MNIDNNYFLNNNISTAHYDIQPYDYFNLTFGEKRHIDAEDKTFIYSMNNYGHRSEDFTSKHNGLHVLFSGCSITFGESLPYKTNWSGKLYNKIKQKNKLSGYYNLSYLGGSIELIVFNIFKYFKNFGNPDMLFLLIPDSGRKILWNSNNNKYENYANPEESNDNKKINLLRGYYNLTMLETYCEKNKIKFLWACWDEKDNKNFYDNINFNNYISLNNKKFKQLS